MGRKKVDREEVVKKLCVQKVGGSRQLVRRDKIRYLWHKI